VRNLIIALLSLLCTIGSAQNEPVEVIYVSITGVNQDITIKWKPCTDTSAIDGYKIFEYYKMSAGVWGYDIPIDSALKTDVPQRTFHYNKALTQPVKFVVVSYKKTRGPYSNISQTIYNSMSYDSCSSSLNLRWTQYCGWGNKNNLWRGNIKEYRIIDPVNGNIVGKTTDTVYTVNNVLQNKTYKYYILAIHTSDTITSQSNIGSIYTGTTQPPAFINAKSINYNNGTEEINFQIDASSPLKNYELTRSQNPTGQFISIGSYTVLTSSFKANDPSPLPSTAYYRLESMNNCKQPTTISNTATAIVPKISINAQKINISWDEYLDWPPAGVSEYQIYQKIDNQNYTYYQTVLAGNPLICTVDITSLYGKQLQGNLCYYIKSVSGGANPYESNSQPVCIDLSSEVYIPNAFTPDGNGQNDRFYVTFAFLPTDFTMFIYDRYGYKIIETTDLKGWNGLLKNGKKAPEGSYICILYYTTSDGKKIEKKGVFSLIYP
jgi:gliding motility-associated-like protein